jgi:hypothetical protein
MTAIVIWCAIALQLVGKPNVSAAEYQRATNTQATQTANLQNNQAATTHTDHANNGMPPWYASPEWWLVGVGILTLIGIYYQAAKTAGAAKAAADSVEAINRQAGILERQTKATEEAAEATRDSVRIQQTINRQWLNLDKWNSSGVAKFGDRSRIGLSFDVVNPTDMPLQLKHIEIFNADGNKVFSPNKRLAPTKSHPVLFDIKLSESDITAYSTNWLRLHIFGTIAFMDNFGDRRNQLFGCVCAGGINGLQFNDFEGWLNDDEEDEQNPN